VRDCVGVDVAVGTVVLVAVFVGVEKSGVTLAVLVGVEKLTVLVAVIVMPGVLVGTFGAQSN
jgi:hypothetical protein